MLFSSVSQAGHARACASRLSCAGAVAAFVVVQAFSFSAAATTLETPVGALSGSFAWTTQSQSSAIPNFTSVVSKDQELTADLLTAGPSGWSYTATLDDRFYYGNGGYENGGSYTGWGSIKLDQIPDLEPLAGLVEQGLTITIEGTYSTTGLGSFWLNPREGFLKHDGYYTGQGSFTLTRQFSALELSSDTLLDWVALYPYEQLSGGGARSSTVQIDLTKLTVSQVVTAVPEPSSALLGVLGGLGLLLAVRRVR